MQPAEPRKPDPEADSLGTLSWVGIVLGCALLALLLLSLLGPVGGK